MKKWIPLFLIGISLLLTGCSNGTIYSNYREVEQLQLVRTMGVDRHSEQELELTVSSGKTSESGPSALLSLRAPSLTTASQHLHDYASSKQLFYDHTKFMLLGEETARQGLGEYLGYVVRSTEMRTSIELYVVRGATAKALMTGPEDHNYDISEVMSSVEEDIRLRGDNHAFTVAETVRSLSECGAALVCALTPADTKHIIYSVDTALTPVPNGFGILKDDRLVDYLDAGEAMAACILTNHGGLTPLTLTDSSGLQATVTLEDTKVRYEPVWGQDGRLDAVEVYVSVRAALDELSQPHITSGGGFLVQLGGQLGAAVEERVQAVLAKEQALQADFLGLTPKLRAAGAGRFDALDEPWQNSLDRLEFRVHTQAVVGRAGDLDDSVSSEGGGMLHVPGQ